MITNKLIFIDIFNYTILHYHNNNSIHIKPFLVKLILISKEWTEKILVHLNYPLIYIESKEQLEIFQKIYKHGIPLRLSIGVSVLKDAIDKGPFLLKLFKNLQLTNTQSHMDHLFNQLAPSVSVLTRNHEPLEVFLIDYFSRFYNKLKLKNVDIKLKEDKFFQHLLNSNSRNLKKVVLSFQGCYSHHELFLEFGHQIFCPNLSSLKIMSVQISNFQFLDQLANLKELCFVGSRVNFKNLYEKISNLNNLSILKIDSTTDTIDYSLGLIGFRNNKTIRSFTISTGTIDLLELVQLLNENSSCLQLKLQCKIYLKKKLIDINQKDLFINNNSLKKLYLSENHDDYDIFSLWQQENNSLETISTSLIPKNLNLFTNLKNLFITSPDESFCKEFYKVVDKFVLEKLEKLSFKTIISSTVVEECQDHMKLFWDYLLNNDDGDHHHNGFLLKNLVSFSFERLSISYKNLVQLLNLVSKSKITSFQIINPIIGFTPQDQCISLFIDNLILNQQFTNLVLKNLRFSPSNHLQILLSSLEHLKNLDKFDFLNNFNLDGNEKQFNLFKEIIKNHNFIRILNFSGNDKAHDFLKNRGILRTHFSSFFFK
ncbi:hypothetical protein CYY_010204 [Polysphondylium violaceum]|uniref:Uncharacterized protein n=1 Tax=Polysphondylium violaceum TaxID=133409 RepID=A0A8J4PS13_9MYCE|nr:hypothetical protein CYY_010204 [Polysphondylium violaceum]